MTPRRRYMITVCAIMLAFGIFGSIAGHAWEAGEWDLLARAAVGGGALVVVFWLSLHD